MYHDGPVDAISKVWFTIIYYKVNTRDEVEIEKQHKKATKTGHVITFQLSRAGFRNVDCWQAEP